MSRTATCSKPRCEKSRIAVLSRRSRVAVPSPWGSWGRIAARSSRACPCLTARLSQRSAEQQRGDGHGRHREQAEKGEVGADRGEARILEQQALKACTP